MKTAQELIPIAGIITLRAPVHIELWTRARIVRLVVLCLFLFRRIHPGPVESATHRHKSKKDFGVGGCRQGCIALPIILLVGIAAASSSGSAQIQAVP